MKGKKVKKIAWWNWLLGERTIAIECHFCNWMTDEETECEWCDGGGLIIFTTWIADKLKEDFIVAWIS